MRGLYLGAGSGITKALWRLEDLTDASGNANTLTNTNSVAFNPARFGNGADFGASNTTKELYVSSNLGITNGNVTLSVWARQDTEIGAAASQYIFIYLRNALYNLEYSIRYVYGTPI